MPSFDEMFPSRLVNADFLESGPRDGTIVNVSQEAVNAEGDQRWVLSFNEFTQQLPLNKTNGQTLVTLFGADSESWLGQRITLIRQQVDYRGSQVWGVRISLELPGTDPAPQAVAQEGPPPVEPGNDSEIPF